MVQEPKQETSPPAQLIQPATRATFLSAMIVVGISLSVSARMFSLAFWQQDLSRRIAEVAAVGLFLIIPCRFAQMTFLGLRDKEWPTSLENRLFRHIRSVADEDGRYRCAVWNAIILILNATVRLWPPKEPITALPYLAFAMFWLLVLYCWPKSVLTIWKMQSWLVRRFRG